MQNTLFPFGRSVPGSPVKLGNDSLGQFCDANVPKPNQLWRLSPVFRGFILFDSICSVFVHVFVTAMLLVLFSFSYSRILCVCVCGWFLCACLLFVLIINCIHCTASIKNVLLESAWPLLYLICWYSHWHTILIASSVQQNEFVQNHTICIA